MLGSSGSCNSSKCHEFRQRLRIQFRSAEKVDMIRHNHIPANSPTMSIVSRAPFINKNFGDIVASEKRFSTASAPCHKINRRVGPNTLQSSQMFVHYAV